MRNVFAIIVFACLLFLNAGYYFLYQLRLSEIKETMKKEVLRARRNELTQLTFSEKEFASLEWEEDAEFRYKGEMYDVLQTERTSKKIIVWCLNDKKENELKEAFTKTQGEHSHGKKPSQSILKLLKVPYLAGNDLSASTKTRGPSLHTESFYQTLLLQQTKNVLTPPPQRC